MDKNQKIWMWVIGAVVVVAAIIIVVANMPANQPQVSQVTNTNTEPSGSVQDVGTQDTGVSAAPISYADALAKYADRRIQLDKTCQATPNNVTYKDNTGIMIDSRSANTRTVKVGITFTIKPWGFKIVVLPDIYLKAQTLLVDCDSNQNVATVLVQE